MKIIAFGHRKHVGKDTAAKILIKNGWVKISISDPLKHCVSSLYNIPLNYFNDFELKDEILPYWDKTPRELLIWFGTNIIRNEDPDHWIKCMHLRILEYMDYSGSIDIYDAIRNSIKLDNGIIPETKYAPEGIVITDLRFPNEMEYIKKIGGITVKIERDDIDISNDIADDALETYEFDININNNSTFNELWQQVELIVNECKEITELPIY